MMNRLIASAVLMVATAWSGVPQVFAEKRSGTATTSVVMLIAEREYQTDKSLRAFVKERLDPNRFHVTFVLATKDDRNQFTENIKSIESADVLLVSVRRRALPVAQLKLVRDYVDSGKPVIGIRTANHAFSLRGKEPPEGGAVWEDWDAQVFGGNYTNHHGNKLVTTVNVSDASSPLVKGIKSKQFRSGGSLYQVAPLAKGAKVVMTGSVEGHDAQPVAWTFQRANGGKSFYTSLGHVDDFAGDPFPQLMINVIEWAAK